MTTEPQVQMGRPGGEGLAGAPQARQDGARSIAFKAARRSNKRIIDASSWVCHHSGQLVQKEQHLWSGSRLMPNKGENMR